MKNKVKYFIVLAVTIAVACQSTPEQTLATVGTLSEAEEIAWGKKLVITMDCGQCHSPKVFTQLGPAEDQSRLLSGHPQSEVIPSINKSVLTDWVLFGQQTTMAVGPWGVSFSANLTSDETGIGNWTFEQFKIALTKGKYKGIENARDLLPPMPWPSYSKLEEAELKAIFKYLKSTTPIRNIVPAPIPFDEL